MIKNKIVLAVTFLAAIGLVAMTANAVPPDGVDITSPPGGAPVDGSPGTIPIEIVGLTLQSQSPLPFDVFVCPTGALEPGAPRAGRDAAGCTTITDHQLGPIGPDGLSAPMTLGTWDTTNEPQFPTDSFFDVFLEVYIQDPDTPVNEQLVDWDWEQQIQIQRPDVTLPVINSVVVEHELIDTEYYQSGGGNGGYKYFDDPKCTLISIEASDDREERPGGLLVLTNVGSVLEQMFADIGGFNPDAEAWAEYLAMDMHATPVAEFNGDTGFYEYEFCAGEHIYHLYDNSVLEWNDLQRFISEGLVLGQFAMPVSVFDEADNHGESSAIITIVDLTVPVQPGWNLRATPLSLDGDRFWPTDAIDAVLSWNAETQSWELVTDDRHVPLEALYFHATGNSHYGIIFDRDLTAPAAKELNEGWNLAGVALEMTDEISWCIRYYGWEGCRDYYGDSYLYLTDLYSNDACVGEVFDAVAYDSNGNRAVEVVVAPREYLSFSDEDDNSWQFQQNGWVWVPIIQETGASPVNQCTTKEEFIDEGGYDYTGGSAWVQNFGGYWVFMDNADTLPGFTTTPLPFYYSD
ncbi:MAG: hypothetical protein HYW25_05360 [Candidatus Aenigmarchaeota archaeon]|nr:hypothetical protein [Candidatus Aenigmarchaeota archaeon]